MNWRGMNKKGDTIVEVMLAMSLLTAFLFISWGITNKATQIGMNSRKRVEMVNAMKEQAEAIKAVAARRGVSEVIQGLNAAGSTIEDQACASVAEGSVEHSFYYQSSGSQLVRTNGQKQKPDTNNTLWVQYRPELGDTPTYYDFFIRACWQTVGSVQNTDNAQFIVRLNNVPPVITPETPLPPTPSPEPSPSTPSCDAGYILDTETNTCIQRYGEISGVVNCGPVSSGYLPSSEVLPSTSPVRYRYTCIAQDQRTNPFYIAPTISCTSPYTVGASDQWRWCEAGE